MRKVSSEHTNTLTQLSTVLSHFSWVGRLNTWGVMLQGVIGTGLKIQPVSLSHFSWLGRLNTRSAMMQVFNEMVMLETRKHNHMKRRTPDRPPRH